MIAQFPLDKFKVTSPFGWRVHPTQNTKKHHNGVDLVGPAGCPVQAFTKGRVVFAGPSKTKLSSGEPGGFGYHVQIRSLINGVYVISTYAHLRKNSIQVKVGQMVDHDTIIGRQGTTGDSTGEHLHFEITLGKKYKWSNDGSGYADPVEFIKAMKAAQKAQASAKVATPEDAKVSPIAVHSTPKAKPKAKPSVVRPVSK
jgi:murein DD-endopeptidase MepM/ murein hydrolase activator NlpD